MINKRTCINKNITMIIFIVSFIACISGIFYFTSFNKNITNPHIKNGVLDLSDWDFEKDGVIELSGEWNFYWNELLTYEDLINNNMRSTGLIEIPGTWNGYQVGNEELKGQGFATYGLKVIINDKRSNLALKLSDMSSAYNLYINGELIAKNGVVGKDKYTIKEEGRATVAEFDAKDSTLEILLQVSNFKHRKGGAWDKIFIGSKEAIQGIRNKELFTEVFLFASIFIMAFYHLVIYLIYRKKVSYLYFSMLCISIACRIIVTNSKPLLIMFPNIHWSHILRMEYLSFYITVPLFATFIYYIFKSLFSKKILYMINTVGIIFSILTMVSKEIIYTNTLIPYQGFTLVWCIYIIYVLIKACINKLEGALILFLGFIILFITVINDILYANEIVKTDHKFAIGVIVFVFFQAILLGQNILKSLTRNELLVIENKIMVDEIMKLNLSLEKRNKELNNIAIHDRLTGVYNRAYFETAIIELDREEQLPISIIIGDVNGLKLANDAFGHLKGDILLKKVVEILKASSKKEDIIARIGGDEFVIILPLTDGDGAEEVIKNIRENCEKADFEPIKPSISLGLSVKYSKEQLMTDIFKEADDNMYKRKLIESKITRSSIKV
jgi:diguanylate cyclase (GGDEF)-like protein